jgi:hypothetical protein
MTLAALLSLLRRGKALGAVQCIGRQFSRSQIANRLQTLMDYAHRVS